MDLTSLALPEESYEADSISVADQSGTVVFSCSQRNGAGNTLAVRMAVESFLGFVATVNEDSFAEPFNRWVNEHGSGERVVQKPEEQIPTPSRIVRAQIGAVTHVGSDAQICFYALSLAQLARAVRSLPAKERLDIRGVVKVTCHTLVLADAIRQALLLAPTLGSREQP